MATFYNDGNYTAGFQTGANLVKYPFGNYPTPDKYARNITSSNRIIPSGFDPLTPTRTSITNNILRSEAINAWTLTAVTASAGVANPSDGQLTALPVHETTANSAHSVACTVATVSGAMVLSVYALAGVRTWIQVILADGTTTASSFFDLALGATGTAANCTPAISNVGYGFYRCSITLTTVSNAASTVTVKLSTDGSTVSYTGVAADGVVLWGAQLETGSTPSAYIYTNGAARTAIAPSFSALIDPFAFLCEETDFQLDGIMRASWIRTYSRIPKTQTMPSSIGITKPVPSNGTTFPQINGSYMVNQPDATLTKYDAYKRVAVTSDSGEPAGYYPSGGTYTVTFMGQTTSALNFNAAAGTVQTALNALSKVSDRGNVTVGGTYNSAGGLTPVFADIATGSTTSSVSSTPSFTVTTSVTPSDGGYSQSVTYTTPAAISMSSIGGTSSLTTTPSSLVTVTAALVSSTRANFAFNPPIINKSITGGTYTVTINGATTGALQYNATFSDIQTAINALGIGVFLVGPWSDGTFAGFPTAYYYYSPYTEYIIVFEVTPAKASITGGTYTMTVLSQTTGNIAYNASISDISTAINALGNVTTRGGVTVTGSGFSSGGISFVFSFLNVQMTGTSSLTPAGGGVAVTSSASGKSQAIHLSAGSTTRTITAAAHGAVSGGTMWITNGTNYFAVTNYTVTDVNTIVLNPTPSDAWGSGATITYAGGRTKQGYQPGGTTIRCNKVTTFYLPGVTFGVDTAGDIPLAQNQSDQANFLEAAYSGAGVINYVVGDLQPYSGPILQQTATQINVIDI